MLVEKLAPVCSSWQDCVLRLLLYLTVQTMTKDDALILIAVACVLISMALLSNLNPKPIFLFHGIYGIVVENDRLVARHLWQMPSAFYLSILETCATVCILVFIIHVMEDIPSYILVKQPLVVCLFVGSISLCLHHPNTSEDNTWNGLNQHGTD